VGWPATSPLNCGGDTCGLSSVLRMMLQLYGRARVSRGVVSSLGRLFTPMLWFMGSIGNTASRMDVFGLI
jgi:hypothetical protein